jgi:poly-gamma-glutamate capsule biosynthesis protein CapA/YwtB (metallophosphatase superfamily)
MGRIALLSLLALLLAPGPAAGRPSPVITVSATGDITLGSHGRYPQGGAVGLLGGVRRYLRGDLVLGNLETVLGDESLAARFGAAAHCPKPPDPCFKFVAPERFARGLQSIGFTMLNVANNHASDLGNIGESMTVGSLARAGLRWTGLPQQIARLTVGGARVAVIGAAPYPWAQNLLDIAGTARLVRQAARSNDIVIVTMHLGAEGVRQNHVRAGMEYFFEERRGDPIGFTHAMVDAGADLVVGHAPHVLRGLEWYRGRLIAYSLGNFSGYHTLSTAGDLGTSAVLRVTLDARGRLVKGRVIPLRLDASGKPRLDPTHRAWHLLRQLSESDFGTRAAHLTRRGEIVPHAN